MSDSDFDRMFSGAANGSRPFTDRVGRPAPSEAMKDDTGTGIYRPYGHLATGDICETCDVQRWLDGTDTPEGIEFQYRFLMQIAYVGEEEIRLFLPDCIIVITGRNLRELRKKLARRLVTFIQQYSARVWPELPKLVDTVVEAIAVIRHSDA